MRRALLLQHANVNKAENTNTPDLEASLTRRDHSGSSSNQRLSWRHVSSRQLEEESVGNAAPQIEYLR